MKKYTITSEIVQAQHAIENVLSHAEIQKKMAAYNYDRKRLLEGKTLYEKVRMLHLTKQDKYGAQYKTTDALQDNVKQVKVLYKRHLKIARLTFENNRGIEEQLQLRGKRKGDMDGWLEQAYTFYSKIESFTGEITQYNVSREELSQATAMVEALYTTRQQQLQSKGDAQHATQQRNEVRRELKAWMSRFRKTARIALQDEPQLLEALGILVLSKKI